MIIIKIYNIQYYIYIKGVVRTNCLDCMDRTNVLQMRVGALMLEEMFKCFDINLHEI